MDKIGMVAGSFDPITLGHVHVIKEAVKMVDLLYVAVAKNSAKKHLLHEKVRHILTNAVLAEELTPDDFYRTKTIILPKDEFTARFAQSINASFIFRGIRNVADFEYENAQQLINKKIAPKVTTVFFMPPADLVSVSSSALRSMIGIKGWDVVAEPYLPSLVIKHLQDLVIKHLQGQET